MARPGAISFVDRVGDHGAKPGALPLLFVHGWGVSSAAFTEFFDCLAPHYRVIAPDLPGFGASRSLGQPVSYAAYADVLARLLDDLGIAVAHVAGMSMGGGIALTFAARHPGRVRSLVLMAPTGCPDATLPTLAFNRVAEFADQITSSGHAHGKGRVARSFVANLLGHPASLLATVRMLASKNILADSVRVEAPTLLLWGDRDKTIPLRLARQFAERLPNATLEVMPDTFHEMATARPIETAAILHDFITRSQP